MLISLIAANRLKIIPAEFHCYEIRKIRLRALEPEDLELLYEWRITCLLDHQQYMLPTQSSH